MRADNRAGLTYAFCKKNHKMERAFVIEQCFFGFFRKISCLGPNLGKLGLTKRGFHGIQKLGHMICE